MLTRLFEVIPAIDVLEGRAVRLHQGRREEVTLEGGDPVGLARRYCSEGASRLHVVDLDGAFEGAPNVPLVEQLVEATGLPVQVGGGYRTIETVGSALAAGADRVMVGTAALESDLLEEAVGRFGEAIVVAIDVRDGRITTRGWTKTSQLTPFALATRCTTIGVRRVLVTSTQRDGSLEGPDLALLDEVVTVGPDVIAAGGISSLADLVAVRALGCEGAIVGSALLAGRFTLSEAIAAVAA